MTKMDKPISEGQQKILDHLTRAVVQFKEKDCRHAAQALLDNGMDPLAGLTLGLVPGMKKAGILFDTNVYFVPEVMLCTDAFYAALKILQPHLPKTDDPGRLTVVIGTILGDVHDIGKNLVKIMFEVQGWDVHDLGRDVPFERFLQKHEEIQSDFIAISAMMTTTMMGMKKVIAMAKEHDPHCLIMLGGASVTREIADLFGADGYAASSMDAVDEALKMIAHHNAFQQKNT